MKPFVRNLSGGEASSLKDSLQVIVQYGLDLEGKGVSIIGDFNAKEFVNVDQYQSEDGNLCFHITHLLQTESFKQSNGHTRYGLGVSGQDAIRLKSIYALLLEDGTFETTIYLPNGFLRNDEAWGIFYPKDGDLQTQVMDWIRDSKFIENGSIRYAIDAEHGRMYSHDYLQEVDVDSYSIVEETYQDGEWNRGDWIEDWYMNRDGGEYVQNENEEYEFTNGSWNVGVYSTLEEAMEQMSSIIKTK